MSDIFRDPTEGAMARRLDLLRRRRDELITMPHAVRRVVVDRSARSAAGRRGGTPCRWSSSRSSCCRPA